MIILTISAQDAATANRIAANILGFTQSSQATPEGTLWQVKGTADSHFQRVKEIISVNVDDEAKVTAADYSFIDYDDSMFGIVRRSFWNVRHCLCDNDEAIDEIMPKGFIQSLEACYEPISGDMDRGRQALLEAGMTEVLEK